MKKLLLSVLVAVAVAGAAGAQDSRVLVIPNGFRGVVSVDPVPANEYGNASESYHGFEVPGASLDFAYPAPTQVTLKATPDFGYRFVHWSVTPASGVPSIVPTPSISVAPGCTAVPLFVRDYIMAVNAGSSAYYTGIDGVNYEPDTLRSLYYGGSMSGNTAPASRDILGTDEDALYRTARTGSFSYRIPKAGLTQRHFYIVFKFAENTDAQRTFNVLIEGAPYVTALTLKDVVKKHRAYEAAFSFDYDPAEDANQTLDIDFVPTAGQATLSAFVLQDDSGVSDRIDAVMAAIDSLPAAERLNLKIGQMTMAHVDHVTPEEVAVEGIGTVFNGGGDPASLPANSAAGWAGMIDAVQKAAPVAAGVRIPVMYATDVVHGFGHLNSATVFPHNIGIGSADDIDLVERIGRVTAAEASACGVNMTFAPCLAIAKELRWGRVAESYGETPDLVSRMGAALVRGLQAGDRNGTSRSGLSGKNAVAATAKHYLGDGGTLFGTGWDLMTGNEHGPDTELPSPSNGWAGLPTPQDKWLDPLNPPYVNPGLNPSTYEQIRSFELLPYLRAIEQGLHGVMPSYSSIFTKDNFCHTNSTILTDWLKTEFKFPGLVTSDWDGIAKTATRGSASWPTYDQANVPYAVNAGVDVGMTSDEGWEGGPAYFWRTYQDAVAQAVAAGTVSESRIDDAVRRVLRVKLMLNLFENPYTLKTHWAGRAALVGSAAHREVGREAVAKSLVLLKNQARPGRTDKVLPLAPGKYSKIGLVGQWADDIGIQSGCWSLEWQGGEGDIYPAGKTVREALVELGADVVYEKEAYTPVDYESVPEAAGSPWFHENGEANIGQPLTAQQIQNLRAASVIVLAIGEFPVAEEYGDREDLDVLDYQYSMYMSHGERDGNGRRKWNKHKDLMQQIYAAFGPGAPAADRKPIVTLVMSHRPIYLGSSLTDATHVFGKSDAVVELWYPGTEGLGVADVLTGAKNFWGKLPFSWPNNVTGLNDESSQILFPKGYGLTY